MPALPPARSFAASGRGLSSIRASPDGTTPPWIPPGTGRSLAVQRGVAVPERPSSLVMASRPSREKARAMSSAQSATGSLWWSDAVPVIGASVCPQLRHTRLRTPWASVPSRLVRPRPHLGQRSRGHELRRAASSVAGRARCRHS